MISGTVDSSSSNKALVNDFFGDFWIVLSSYLHKFFGSSEVSNNQRHSIYMMSIQIDTKALNWNNIKSSFFKSHMKRNFPLCMFNICMLHAY